MTNRGIPAHEPTSESRAKVEALVAFGIKQDHIALQLGISDETLRKYYKTELEIGLSNAINMVANKLFSKAVDQDDLAAQIFFLKTRGRWREKDPDDDKKAWSVIEQLLAMKKDEK